MTVPVGAGLPALPKKMIKQIQSGQYVDFCELPPAKGHTRSLPSQEEGHIVIVHAEDLTGSCKLMPDLATWMQCLAVYTAVIPVGAGLPALPKKMIEQIQYVDFCELPPAKGRTRPLPSQEEGHIVIVRAEDLTGSC